MLTLLFVDPYRAVMPEEVRAYVKSLVSVAELDIVGPAHYNILEAQGHHFTTMCVNNGDDRYSDLLFVMFGGTHEMGTCLSPEQFPETAKFYNELLNDLCGMCNGVLGDYQFMHALPDGRRVGTYSIVMGTNPFQDVKVQALRAMFKVV